MCDAELFQRSLELVTCVRFFEMQKRDFSTCFRVVARVSSNAVRRMMDELDLTATDRDICEPLDTVSVCQNLNDSETLCQPSRWAGEAIQDAVNATQLAMADLRAALQFYVSSAPYDRARVNASRLVFQVIFSLMPCL